MAAPSLGLGSMWVSALRNPEIDKKTKQLLNIPSYLRIFEMMALGYPGMKPTKKKLRDLAGVIHYNGADNYRSQEEVDNWF